MAAAGNPPVEPGICPCCGSDRLEVIFSQDGVPSNSCILLASREEALGYPRGDIRLAFCAACGFAGNMAFDPVLTEYSARYEETQAYSATFNSFQDGLARALVERHGLRGKDIIEVGCGKGEFLRLLCDLGDNRGLGFDPGYSPARGEAAGASRFRVIRDFFADAHAGHAADFVACKMTLEHIPQPAAFLRDMVRTARRPGAVVFIQVPESLRILRDCAFEDIYYEHCSYFSAGTLARLFTRLGLEVLDADVAYDGQYLTVEAGHPDAARPRVAPAVADDLAVLRELAGSFRSRVGAVIDGWQQRLAGWQSAGRKVVIWGSGSKGVAFMHGVPGASLVSHAVDINPYRQGAFMPGSGLEIIGPERLVAVKPDVVVVMNRIYVPEIRASLAGLGLAPEIAAL